MINMNTIKEDVERFKKIVSYKSPRQSLKEYTFVTTPLLNEDGEDDEVNNTQDTDNQSPNNGQMGSEEQLPEEPTQAQDMTAGDFGVDEDNIDTEEMEEGDEVVDVDELVNSQEATEYKVDAVDDRITDLLKAFVKFSDILDQQAHKIDDLKSEIEKRNPTEEERLNIRSQNSYPYSETPSRFWDRKTEENSNYKVIYNNDVPPSKEQQEFKIRQSDIDNINLKDISDSLNVKENIEDYLQF